MDDTWTRQERRSQRRGQDAERVAEGELCTILAIASADREDVLSQDEVDRLLGLAPR
jgi:hypothetical protein